MLKILKNYLYNASYQVFVLIVPLITAPYLSRVLEPTGVGINAFTNSVIQYFIIFGSIGVALYGNRQVAYVRDNKHKLTNTFYEIFFMRAITICIAFIAFFIFLALVHQYRVYYLFQSLSLLAAAFDITWFFQGVEDFAVTVVRNFVVKIITLISIFLFVKNIHDVGIYILILSLSLLIGNLTLFPSLKKFIGKPNWHDFHLLKHFWPSLVLFIPDIAIQVYAYVNQTMLGVMTNVSDVSFFSQSDKIVKMSLAVVTAMGMVMLPHVANAYARGQHDEVKNSLYKSFEFVTALAIPIGFGIMAITPRFVPLFFSFKFMPVIPIMIVEAPIILLIAWSNAIGQQYLVPTNQNKAYNTSVIVGAIINIIANIPLIMLWGAVGTAVATVLSEISVTGVQMYAVKDQISFKKLFKGLGRYFVPGVLMFVVVFAMNVLLPMSWKWLIVEIIAGILVYPLLLVLFKAPLALKGVAFLKNKFISQNN